MSAIEHLPEERLLDLVNGLLPGTARREAIAHLSECEACAARMLECAAARARSHARMAAAVERLTIRATPGNAGVLPFPDDATRNRDASQGGKTRTSRTWRQSAPFLAAAALIAVFGVGAFLLAPRPASRTGLPPEWLPTPEATVATRDSADVPADPLIARGLAAYRDHDATSARRLLSRAQAQGALEQVRRLYLGNALLQLGEHRAALASLRDVDWTQVPEPWRGEGRWSLAAALDAAGDERAADSLRRFLAERSDEIGERARRALAPPAKAP